MVTELAPRLISATVAAANFERRQGCVEAACQLYAQLLSTFRGDLEREAAAANGGGSGLDILRGVDRERERAGSLLASQGNVAFVALQYARFLRACGKAGQGREGESVCVRGGGERGRGGRV